MPADRPLGPHTLPEPRLAAPSDTPAGSDTPTPGTPAAAPAEWPVIPGYAVTGMIAEGGMGAVYAARDLTLNREVAVKTVLPRLASDGRYAAQFDREVHLMARLSHPGVPPVHALGALPDGRPFLAMKLIRGRTLADELTATDRVTNRPRLLGVFEQICQAVGYAHAQGLIHRDLKPSNVMVGEFGEVQVMDWGLAKETRGAEFGTRNGDGNPHSIPNSEETAAGQAKGTPAFMAPEQARGEWETVDARADVFALGGILCVLLTGKPAFAKEGFFALMRQAGNADLGDCFARLDACGADAELVELCKRCLAAVPADRPADGRAVAEAVAAYRAGVDERARRAEADRAAAQAEAREQRKRRKVQLALVATVALLVAVAAGAWWWQDKQRTDATNASIKADTDRQVEEARLKGVTELKIQQARQGITDNLRLTVNLRKQGDYREAEAALKLAAELARESAPERQGEVAAEAATLKLAWKLEEIRFRKWDIVTNLNNPKGFRFDDAHIVRDYTAVLKEQGFDLNDPDEALVAWVNSSAIRAEVIAAIDDWVAFEYDSAKIVRLLGLLRRIEPHPWLDRFRQPTVRPTHSPAPRFSFTTKLRLTVLAADALHHDLAPTALAALAVQMSRAEVSQDRMIRLLEKALARHPNEFQVLFSLGVAYNHWSNSDERRGAALGAFLATLALRPENTAVMNFVAVCFSQNGNHAAAEAMYRKILALKPTHLYGLGNLANSLYGRRQITAAEELYKRAVDEHPRYVQALHNLGVIHINRRECVAAAGYFRRAAEAEPTSAMTHAMLGHALRCSGDIPGARAAYEEAARLDPKYKSLPSTLPPPLPQAPAPREVKP